MFRIESKIDTQSVEYKENFKHMEGLVAEYRDRLTKVQEGGPPKYRERHQSRKKLLVRERLEKLFDRNTPFLAAWEWCTAGKFWSSPTTPPSKAAHTSP
jgi:3-methylcrotonyl-CoA carboxylase beta subunit